MQDQRRERLTALPHAATGVKGRDDLLSVNTVKVPRRDQPTRPYRVFARPAREVV